MLNKAKTKLQDSFVYENVHVVSGKYINHVEADENEMKWGDFFFLLFFFLFPLMKIKYNNIDFFSSFSSEAKSNLTCNIAMYIYILLTQSTQYAIQSRQGPRHATQYPNTFECNHKSVDMPKIDKLQSSMLNIQTLNANASINHFRVPVTQVHCLLLFVI